MVHIVNKPELKMKERLARRGYNEEDWKKVLDNSKRIGDVTILKKRSFRKNSLKDYVKANSC